MGRHTLARTRRYPRLALFAGVASAALFVVGADSYPHAGDAAACCEAAEAPQPPPAVAVNLMAAQPPAPIVPATLPQGVAPENGLQVDTILAARAVSAQFPEILDIGGVRSDALRWHPHGLAIDVMIPHARSAAGKELGDKVLAYVMANAERFGLEHAIWRQTLYRPDGSKKAMSDRGSGTANHYDHVHIATAGGGYPREGRSTSADPRRCRLTTFVWVSPCIAKPREPVTGALTGTASAWTIRSDHLRATMLLEQPLVA